MAAGYDVAIVSIDKDFFQLVADPHVKVYDPREDGTWFDEAGVVQKFGVKPSQVVDVLALVGDTSDNVAGVPGIGKKGAIDLMTRFGSLDALLERTAELKPKQRETLTTHRDAALQSRELVTIRTDVPLDVDLATFAYRGASREKCYELFTRLAFRTLVNDYAPTMESTPHEYELVTTASAFDALVARLTAARRVRHPDRDRRRRGGARSDRRLHARRWPIARRPTCRSATRAATHGGDLLSAASRPDQLELTTVLERLKPLLEDAGVRKLGHDLKQETILLGRHGVTLRGVEFDAMLGSYLLDANRSSHGLPEIALEHLGYRAIDQESVAGKGVKAVPLVAARRPTRC